MKRYAINQLGNALAASGSTFASDEDPELIRAAVPFSLKLIESLLAENPRHEGLLLAAARGFTQYAYAFVQEDADELEDTDKVTSTAMRARAAKLYLRARNYGLRGLELKHPDFAQRLKANPKEAVKELKKSEAPMMYWTAISWGAALAASHDFMMFPEIPRFEALIDRVIELDEAFDEGTVHTFLITYEMSRLNAKPNRIALAKEHFDRAMALGGGHQAGPLVAYAENVLVAQKDKTGFQNMLRQALKVDINQSPENRELNLAEQRRARWLLSRTEKLFPPPR
ncbi:MAG TPA: TRAP transporter TatT component family protein [Bryobacteraceae bacterium]|nr:TRAP transporter TatT component family protein [Bryobacteraceae bacterium]